MIAVADFSEQNVGEASKEHIKPGSTIKSDAYSSYKVLSKYGYFHNPIKIGFPELARKYLPWVHILISNAKAIHIGTHHGVSNQHLQNTWLNSVIVSTDDTSKTICLIGSSAHV